MKFISIIAAILIASLGTSTLVSGSSQPIINIRVIFNNGLAPTSATTCTADDNVKIDQAMRMLEIVRRNRHLRSPAESSSMMNDQSSTSSINAIDTTADSSSSERELFPAFCADLCAGYVPRTCRVLRCAGFRRNRILNEASKDEVAEQEVDGRELSTLHINNVINGVHNSLDLLISSTNQGVTSPCKLFIARGNRNITWAENAIYGEITNVAVHRNVVVLTPSTVINSNLSPSGWSVCRSQTLIQFVASGNECVQDVRFIAGGAATPLVTTADKFIVRQFVTRTGLYTLSVIPNNAVSRAKNYTYTVNNC